MLKVKFFLGIILLTFLIFPVVIQAQGGLIKEPFRILLPAKFVAERADYGTGDVDIRLTIAKVVQYLLSFLAVIFFIIIIYAGWLWMTAGGNEEQVTKAKNLMKNGAIGLLIIMAAYAISYFVLSYLSAATDYAAEIAAPPEL